MKICSCCKIEKDESEFGFKYKQKGILNSCCRLCLRKKSAKNRAKKFKEHKCSVCSKIIEEGNNTQRCNNCRKEHNIINLLRIKKLIESHKCKGCGIQLSENTKKNYCESCLNKKTKKRQ